jgi:hypothetical protein
MDLPPKHGEIVGNILLACTRILFFVCTHTHAHTHTHLSFSLNLALFPTSYKCNYLWLYTPIPVYRLYLISSLCDQSGDCTLLKCVCVLYVSYSKCAENIFIIEESTSPVKHKNKWGRSVTVPSEFLEFYLLLYAAYS